MKEFVIRIEHNLTPFHQECMEGFVRATLEGIENYWQEKSVKHFKIHTDKS